MSGSDNACYVYENEGLNAFNSGITFQNLQPARTSAEHQPSGGESGAGHRVSRVCAVCGGPLMKRWQTRTCSHRCAGGMTPVRPQGGTANGNWRGGKSKRPSESYVGPWKAKNPEKVAAQRIVAAAIRKGWLARPHACDSCLRSCKPDAHHHDYSRPLSAEWLCRKCHVAADKLRAAQDALKAASAQAQQSKGDFNGVDACAEQVGAMDRIRRRA